MELQAFQEAFGNKLNQLMTEQKLSFSQLHNSTQLGKTYLRQITEGKCNVSLDVIRRLSIALKVPPTYFFDWQ